MNFPVITRRLLNASPIMVAVLLTFSLYGCGGRGSEGQDVDTLTSTSVLVAEPDSLNEDFLGSRASDRENWQKPQIVISCLGDLSDKVVADIGAGTGYFTIPLSRLAKKVIAIDIEREFLDHINRRLARLPERDALDVETRATVPDDPALKANEADLVLLVNTYSFIDHRVAYFQKVLQGLKPGGRVVVVDFMYENLPVGPPIEEKVPPSLVVSQLDSAGFEHVSTDSVSLEYQFLVTMKRK